MTTLTSRERVNRALERREHDRVPRAETFWPETLERWAAEGLEGGQEQVYRLLDCDLRQTLWYWPNPYPGRCELVSEDAETKVIRNEAGALLRFWKGKSGTPEHLGWECDSPDIWREEFLPRFLNQPIQVNVDQVRESYAIGVREARWTHLSGVEPFEILRALLGDEVSLMAMIEEPEWVEEIARVSTDTTLRNYQAVLDAGIRPDGIWTYGDMAYNHGTHCSPATYRELVWPQHRRLAEFAHANGMKLIFHTDGDVNRVIDMYIEAGIDCLQPLECKANMDIRRLCPEYGSRLSFFGNIDVRVLSTNDLDAIENEVTAKLAAGMATRNYIFHSDHSIPPQVSWPTYRHIIQLVEKHGNYA